MNANIKIGRISGIPINLHWSWFLVFILVTWSLAGGYLVQEYPGLSQSAYWLLGAVTSILFFISVLLHELGHSIIAIRNKIPVKNISLFIFGGIAQIEQEPRSAGVEFKVAIAGPVVSLILATVFNLLYQLDSGIPYLAAPSIWLARINFSLALFNMIPGFPLDGGRVLRAIVWAISHDFNKATRIAAFTGELAAFGFIAFGMYTILTGGSFINGMWIAFIGWFLQNAAGATLTQTTIKSLLQGVRVDQVMDCDCQRVSNALSLDRLVEDRILTGGHRCFIVSKEEADEGLITLKDITAIPRDDWRYTTTGNVMVTWDKLVTISPKTPLLEALQIMDNANIAQIPVAEAGRVAGMLTREQIIHYMRLRSELRI
jgi:Zn-dependent protease